MPSFLALQCFKCSMMQVKQQKKSSNKWICSICNEKQSVRNVFASSMSAKDIRIFVQEFNLSRNRISLVDHNSADADTHGYTEVQEKNEGEEEKPFANRYEEHGFHQYEDEFGCLNVQRNISYYDDPLKKESSCDKYTAPQRNVLFDGLRSSDSVQKKSKWDEFLTPQGNEMLEELEDTLRYKGNCGLSPEVRNAEFVTEFPEKKNLKRKNMNETPSNKSRAQVSHTSAKNKSEICNSKYQKENYLQFGPNKNTLYAKMQRPSEDHLEEVKTQRNSVLESQRPKCNVMKKPVSKWATFLDPDEAIVNQSSIGDFKEEAQVASKWEKYGKSDHVDRTVTGMESHNSPVESGNSDSETIIAPERIPRTANVWSLKASSKNLQCLDGLITAQLD